MANGLGAVVSGSLLFAQICPTKYLEKNMVYKIHMKKIIKKNKGREKLEIYGNLLKYLMD